MMVMVMGVMVMGVMVDRGRRVVMVDRGRRVVMVMVGRGKVMPVVAMMVVIGQQVLSLMVDNIGLMCQMSCGTVVAVPGLLHEQKMTNILFLQCIGSVCLLTQRRIDKSLKFSYLLE